MKKTICLLLSLLLLCSGALSENVENTDMTGAWYGDLFGIVSTLTIEEDGTYLVESEGIEPQEGIWTLNNSALVLDEGTENELSLSVSADMLVLSLDGLTFRFTREMPTAFVPAAINADAALEQFAGEWSMTHLTSMGLLFDGNTLGIHLSLNISGSDALAYIYAGTSEDAESYCAQMQGTFESGVLTLTEILPDSAAADESGQPIVWSVQLLADGTMCITDNTVPEYPVYFYMTPIMPLLLAE